MKTHYHPIYPDYYEIFSQEQEKEFSKVFYFGDDNNVEEAKGKINGLVNGGSIGEFLIFDSRDEVRIDRIITINGIPGPAYDEYDAYALACLNCNVPSD
ncbi:MAG: hypothetical protein H7X84_00380 [Verrucomicrobia bacterium]|nr:hypothetical protein [Prolixibacteraceae bacterium]